jgi:hypothetical protein
MVLCQNLSCLFKGEHDEPSEYVGAHRMELEFDLRDDPEVASSPSNGPEQIAVIARASA